MGFTTISLWIGKNNPLGKYIRSADTPDRLRLVMPPVLFVVLSTPMTKLAHFIFPTAVANGVISGAFTFCRCYCIAIVILHSSPFLKT